MRKNGFIFGLAYLLAALSALGLGNWQRPGTSTASIDVPAVIEQGDVSVTVPQPMAQETPREFSESNLAASMNSATCEPASAADKSSTVVGSDGISITHSVATCPTLVLDLSTYRPSGILITEVDTGSVVGARRAIISDLPTTDFLPNTIASDDLQISRQLLQTIYGVSLSAGCCVTAASPEQTPSANCQFQPTLQGPFSSDPVATQFPCDNLGFDKRHLCQEAVTGISFTMNSTKCTDAEVAVAAQSNLPEIASRGDIDFDSLVPSSVSEDEAKTLQELHEKLVALVTSKAKLQSEKSLKAEISRTETETANLQAARKFIEARESLNKIIVEFPDSPAASRAKMMLEMKSSGPAKTIAPVSILPMY